MTKVIVRISQGLANRMFQVAYALSLREKGYEVKLDYVRNNKFKHEDVELNNLFKYSFQEASYEEIVRYNGIDSLFNKIIRRIPPLSKCRIISFDKGFSPSHMVYKQSAYVIGTFQSYYYFMDVEEKVRDMYTFPELKDKRSIELVQKMCAEQSVAIHVRKGFDYQKPILQNTCMVDYYAKAIEYFQKKLDNPVFYIFTDNQTWVKDNIKNIDYTLVDWNPTTGPQNYLDMQLMSLAKHNIIANSTYSWWSAWLNKNPNKMIVAPENWYNPLMKHLQDLDIVPERWLKF